MKKLFVLALLLSGSASAEVYVPTAKVEMALRAAAELTRYDLPAVARPRAALVTREWLIDRTCPQSRNCGTVGLWLLGEPNVVYIADDVPEEKLNVILVHELTHWLQSRQWPVDFKSCANYQAHEAEAYVAGYLFDVIYQGRQKAFWLPLFPCPADLE